MPDLPTDGTFAPAEPLSTLTGEDAAGEWALEVRDASGSDPTCYYGAQLTVQTNENPPVADDVSVWTAFQTAVPVTLPGTDADADPLTFTIDGVSGIGGSVQCDSAGDPNCTFTPPAGVSGDAVIAYSVSDGVSSAPGTVTVQVADPEVASLTVTPSAFTVAEGESVTLTVTGATQSGFDMGDVTGDVVFTSDIDTDEIDGNQVTFLTSSSHTITATHVPSNLTQDVVIEVTPTAVMPPGETSSTLPAAASQALPATGGPPEGALVAGLLAFLAGVGLLVRRKVVA